jgi:hypothetical protein
MGDMLPRERMERTHLAQATRHIAEAKQHIAHQLLAIQRLTAKGLPTEDAYSTLAAFEGSLRALERHRSLILDRLP